MPLSSFCHYSQATLSKCLEYLINAFNGKIILSDQLLHIKNLGTFSALCLPCSKYQAVHHIFFLVTGLKTFRERWLQGCWSKRQSFSCFSFVINHSHTLFFWIVSLNNALSTFIYIDPTFIVSSIDVFIGYHFGIVYFYHCSWVLLMLWGVSWLDHGRHEATIMAFLWVIFPFSVYIRAISFSGERTNKVLKRVTIICVHQWCQRHHM